MKDNFSNVSKIWLNSLLACTDDPSPTCLVGNNRNKLNLGSEARITFQSIQVATKVEATSFANYTSTRILDAAYIE